MSDQDWSTAGTGAYERVTSSPATFLVTASEAARILGVGRTTLYALMNQGHLRPMHIGRSLRVSLARTRAVRQLAPQQRRDIFIGEYQTEEHSPRPGPSGPAFDRRAVESTRRNEKRGPARDPGTSRSITAPTGTTRDPSGGSRRCHRRRRRATGPSSQALVGSTSRLPWHIYGTFAAVHPRSAPSGRRYLPAVLCSPSCAEVRLYRL
jgi:excisionase family DNA binding protein